MGCCGCKGPGTELIRLNVSAGPEWNVGAPGRPQHQTVNSFLKTVVLNLTSIVKDGFPDGRISNYARWEPAYLSRARRFVGRVNPDEQLGSGPVGGGGLTMKESRS